MPVKIVTFSAVSYTHLFGGEFISSVTKIIERAIVAAKREGIIKEAHVEEGAVAGAAKEAVSQIVNHAIGLKDVYKRQVLCVMCSRLQSISSGWVRFVFCV